MRRGQKTLLSLRMFSAILNGNGNESNSTKALNSTRQTRSLHAPEKGVVNIPPSRHRLRECSSRKPTPTAHYHQRGLAVTKCDCALPAVTPSCGTKQTLGFLPPPASLPPPGPQLPAGGPVCPQPSQGSPWFPGITGRTHQSIPGRFKLPWILVP